MIRFNREDISPDLVSEIMPLAHEHFDEIDPFTDKPPALAADQYVRSAPFLRVFTVREEGILTGYAVFVVAKHPHYENRVMAQQDLLYLSVGSRHGRTGLDFMKFCDNELAGEGVEAIFQFSGTKRNIGTLLEYMGYEPIQTLYAKRCA